MQERDFTGFNPDPEQGPENDTEGQESDEGNDAGDEADDGWDFHGEGIA